MTDADRLAALRAEFLRFLTTDSETKDRRRREFNQAIFDAERGFAIFNGTDLDMVMSKFDKAAAGVTLDPRPHVADVECAVCGKPSIGSFDLCGDHGRYGGVDLVPRDDDRWYDVARPAPDKALREAALRWRDAEDALQRAAEEATDDDRLTGAWKMAGAEYGRAKMALRAALEAER